MLPRLSYLSLGPGQQVRDGDGDCDENQEVGETVVVDFGGMSVIVVPLCVVARMCPKLKSVTLTQHVDETHTQVMPVSRGTVPDSSDPFGPHVSSWWEGHDEVRRPVVFHRHEVN